MKENLLNKLTKIINKKWFYCLLFILILNLPIFYYIVFNYNNESGEVLKGYSKNIKLRLIQKKEIYVREALDSEKKLNIINNKYYINIDNKTYTIGVSSKFVSRIYFDLIKIILIGNVFLIILSIIFIRKKFN